MTTFSAKSHEVRRTGIWSMPAAKCSGDLPPKSLADYAANISRSLLRTSTPGIT